MEKIYIWKVFVLLVDEWIRPLNIITFIHCNSLLEEWRSLLSVLSNLLFLDPDPRVARVLPRKRKKKKKKRRRRKRKKRKRLELIKAIIIIVSGFCDSFLAPEPYTLVSHISSMNCILWVFLAFLTNISSKMLMDIYFLYSSLCYEYNHWD